MTDDDHSTETLARSVREVAEFIDAQGWDLPPQMFALVSTADLVAAEPTLSDQLEGTELTPIAQEAFPTDVDDHARALEEFLATTTWPESVQGCVLVQQIVVLPPDAESDLDEALAPLLADPDAADEAGRVAASSHPGRRDARLFAGVLRTGAALSLLQLRPDPADDDPFADLDLRYYPDLATNITEALRSTLEADPEEA